MQRRIGLRLISAAAVGGSLGLALTLLLNSVVEDPSADQLDAIIDGVVTIEEYEEGVWATTKCLEDNGLAVTDRWTSGPNDSEIRYLFGFEEQKGTLEEAMAIHAKCYRKHLELIDDLYTDQLYGESTETEIANCVRASSPDDFNGLTNREAIAEALSRRDTSESLDCLPHETLPGP